MSPSFDEQVRSGIDKIHQDHQSTEASAHTAQLTAAQYAASAAAQIHAFISTMREHGIEPTQLYRRVPRRSRLTGKLLEGRSPVIVMDEQGWRGPTHHWLDANEGSHSHNSYILTDGSVVEVDISLVGLKKWMTFVVRPWAHGHLDEESLVRVAVQNIASLKK